MGKVSSKNKMNTPYGKINKGKCFICKKPVNDLHGNPSLWSIRLPYLDGNGKTRLYHQSCVSLKIHQAELLSKKIDLDNLVYCLWCTSLEQTIGSCESMSRYVSFKKEAETHSGDCTNDSAPCPRCFIQRLEVEAQCILNQLARKPKGWCGKECLKKCDFKKEEKKR